MTVYIAKSIEEQRAAGEQFAEQLTDVVKAGAKVICTLSGDLGAGKTSFVQGLMLGLNYRDAVTSPTYNLIHEYPCELGLVAHIDLYRLKAVDELEDLAIYDVIDSSVLTLIEWPEKAEERLPKLDYEIDIQVLTEHRKISVVDHLDYQ